MARTKGSQNKNAVVRPPTSELTDEERMQLVISLIIDRILEDQKNGQKLLKKLREVSQTCVTA